MAKKMAKYIGMMYQCKSKHVPPLNFKGHEDKNFSKHCPVSLKLLLTNLGVFGKV